MEPHSSAVVITPLETCKGSRTGEETGSQTNPDAQLDVFAAVDVHARVQQAELGKVVAVDHEGAADHGRSPDERGNSINFTEIRKTSICDFLFFFTVS